MLPLLAHPQAHPQKQGDASTLSLFLSAEEHRQEEARLEASAGELAGDSLSLKAIRLSPPSAAAAAAAIYMW